MDVETSLPFSPPGIKIMRMKIEDAEVAKSINWNGGIMSLNTSFLAHYSFNIPFFHYFSS
jgi:hypothetical protein